MKYIFYRIILFNGKNKRVYKKETSIKLYCKLNGKMIDIKKYKELCKKLKPKKVKSTKTKKVKSTKTKKVKSTKTKKVKSTKTKKVKSTKTYRGGSPKQVYKTHDSTPTQEKAVHILEQAENSDQSQLRNFWKDMVRLMFLDPAPDLFLQEKVKNNETIAAGRLRALGWELVVPRSGYLDAYWINPKYPHSESYPHHEPEAPPAPPGHQSPVRHTEGVPVLRFPPHASIETLRNLP